MNIKNDYKKQKKNCKRKIVFHQMDSQFIALKGQKKRKPEIRNGIEA
jgi:hypothetical protein